MTGVYSLIEMLHAHNAFDREQGYASISYLIVDMERQEVLSGGEQEIERVSQSASEYRKDAMITALEHAVLHAETNEQVYLFDHKIPNAKELVFNAIPPEIASLISRKELTVQFTSTGNSLRKITHGIMCMSKEYDETFSTHISSDAYEISYPLQLYTDGSHRQETDEIAIGYAFVDDSGTLLGMGADSEQVSEEYSSLEAEYDAVYQGLLRVKNTTPTGEIRLKVDNNRVADVLKGYRDPLERNCTAVTEIQALCDSVPEFSVRETNRSHNRLADSLARYGYNSPISGTNQLEKRLSH